MSRRRSNAALSKPGGSAGCQCGAACGLVSDVEARGRCGLRHARAGEAEFGCSRGCHWTTRACASWPSAPRPPRRRRGSFSTIMLELSHRPQEHHGAASPRPAARTGNQAEPGTPGRRRSGRSAGRGWRGLLRRRTGLTSALPAASGARGLRLLHPAGRLAARRRWPVADAAQRATMPPRRIASRPCSTKLGLPALRLPAGIPHGSLHRCQACRLRCGSAGPERRDPTEGWRAGRLTPARGSGTLRATVGSTPCVGPLSQPQPRGDAP